MKTEKSMKHITVEEFLDTIEEKRYKIKSSGKSGFHTIMDGKDVPFSFKSDTVDDIIAYEDGSFRVSYGVGEESYIFREIKE